MAYLGENNNFYFHNGVCEAIHGCSVSSLEMAELGRSLTRHFSRISAACESFERLHLLYALCSGFSECGGDVFICENSDLPSFRFSAPLLSADCSVFISCSSGVKVLFYDERGFTMPDSALKDIMHCESPSPAEKSGKINVTTSFRNIYINNLRDCSGFTGEKVSAGISCGNRNVRSLWEEFFSGESDRLVFQISDDGQRVNAYSVGNGFISDEKLALAYCLIKTRAGERVLLPDSFHYAAEIAAGSSGDLIKRYKSSGKVPDYNAHSRFLRDPLFMVLELTKDMNRFDSVLKELPALASAKRELAVDRVNRFSPQKSMMTPNGRVIITQSGRNRLSLVAQAMSSETAAELCAVWTEKIRKDSESCH